MHIEEVSPYSTDENFIMLLRKLSILNYKNIIEAELEFSPKINCFIGSNGMGKTNLLDAIYYLSFCRSATNPIDSQVVRHNSDFLMLNGEYTLPSGEALEVYCGIKPGRRKQFKRNGILYRKMSEHIGAIPLVIISPSDSSLIAGGSEDKRNFLDSVISQFDRPYLEACIRYSEALKQRNAMLKAEEEPDPTVIGIYEEVMAQEADYIYTKRKAFIADFIPEFNRFYALISGGGEAVELQYVSQGERGSWLSTIQEGRTKSRIMGYSLHGPHKDDLTMLLAGHAIKREGSQGQNKTFLIALKLAQFFFLRQVSPYGAKPLLLLDDIFDKLDSQRVARLIEIVAQDDFGQIFITDTNREHLDRIIAGLNGRYKLFTINQGEVIHETQEN